MIKVGIIGGGVITKAHLSGLAEIDGVEVVALCSLDESNLRSLCKDWNITRSYTDYRELIADDEVQLVEVLTPVFLHAEMSIAAAEAGKHVITEKPMCRTLKEADEMIRAAAENNVRLMIAESYVFTSPILQARKIIENGEIGDPKVVVSFTGPWAHKEAFQVGEFRKTDSDGVLWRRDPIKMGGGKFPFVFGHFCHFFSAPRYLAGCEKIESIFALPTPSRDWESGEIAVVQWKAGDIVGSWINTKETCSESGFRVRIFGTEGTLEVLGEGAGAKIFGQGKPHISVYRNGETKYLNIEMEEEVIWDSNVGYYYEAHKNELKHFISCIVEDKDPVYTAEDGRKEVLYTLASIKSVLDSRIIYPDEIALDFTPMNNV